MKKFIEAKLKDENILAAIMVGKIIYILRHDDGSVIVFLDGLEPRSLQLEMTYEAFLHQLQMLSWWKWFRQSLRRALKFGLL